MERICSSLAGPLPVAYVMTVGYHVIAAVMPWNNREDRFGRFFYDTKILTNAYLDAYFDHYLDGLRCQFNATYAEFIVCDVRDTQSESRLLDIFV